MNISRPHRESSSISNSSSSSNSATNNNSGSSGIQADERALRIHAILSMLDKSSERRSGTCDDHANKANPHPLKSICHNNENRKTVSPSSSEPTAAQSDEFELVVLNRLTGKSGKRRKTASGKRMMYADVYEENPTIAAATTTAATVKELKCSAIVFTPPTPEDGLTANMAGSGYGVTLEASLLSSSETIAYNSPVSLNGEKHNTPSISFASRRLRLESCTSTDTAGEDMCNTRVTLSPSPMRHIEHASCREFSTSPSLLSTIPGAGVDLHYSPSQTPQTSPTHTAAVENQLSESSAAARSVNSDDSDFFIYHTVGSPRVGRWQREAKKRVSRDTTSETMVFAAHTPKSAAAELPAVVVVVGAEEPKEGNEKNASPNRSGTPLASTGKVSQQSSFLLSPSQRSISGDAHPRSGASLRSSTELVTRRGRAHLLHDAQTSPMETRLETSEGHATSFYSLLDQYARCRHNYCDTGMHSSCISETLSVGNSLCSITPRNAVSLLDGANSRGSIAYTRLSPVSLPQGNSDSARHTPLPPSHCPSHRTSQILALAQLGVPVSSQPVRRSPNAKVNTHPPAIPSPSDSALDLLIEGESETEESARNSLEESRGTSSPPLSSESSSTTSTWFVDTDLEDEEEGRAEEVCNERNEKVRSEFSYETSSDTSEESETIHESGKGEVESVAVGQRPPDVLQDGPVLFSTAAMPTVRPNHYDTTPRRRTRPQISAAAAATSPYSGIMRGRPSIPHRNSSAISPSDHTIIQPSLTCAPKAMDIISMGAILSINQEEEKERSQSQQQYHDYDGDEDTEATMSRILLRVERSGMSSDELQEETTTSSSHEIIISDSPKDPWSKQLSNYCAAARNLLLVANAERSLNNQPILYENAFAADVIPFGRAITNLMRLVEVQRAEPGVPEWSATSAAASATEMSSLHFPECGESETVDEALFTRAKESCTDSIRKEHMIAAFQEFFSVLDRIEVEVEGAQQGSPGTRVNRRLGDSNITDVVGALLHAFREQITLHIECLLLQAIAQRYPDCVVHNSESNAQRIRTVATSIRVLVLSQLGSAQSRGVQSSTPRAHDTHSKAWARSRILSILFCTQPNRCSEGTWTHNAFEERDHNEDAVAAFEALQNYLDSALLSEKAKRCHAIGHDRKQDGSCDGHGSNCERDNSDAADPLAAAESACEVWINVQEDLRSVLVSGTRSLSTPNSARLMPETYGEAVSTEGRKNDAEWAEEVLTECMSCVPRALSVKRSLSLSEVEGERQQQLWFSILQLVHELVLTQPYTTTAKREIHDGAYVLNTRSSSSNNSNSNISVSSSSSGVDDCVDDTRLTVNQLLHTRIAERRTCIDLYCKRIRSLSRELTEWLTLRMLPAPLEKNETSSTFLGHIRTFKRFLIRDIQRREERRQANAFMLKTDCSVAEVVKRMVVNWRTNGIRTDENGDCGCGAFTEHLAISFPPIVTSNERRALAVQMEELSQHVSALAIESLRALHEQQQHQQSESGNDDTPFTSPLRRGTTLLQNAVEQLLFHQRAFLAKLEESVNVLGTQQQQTPLRSSDAFGIEPHPSEMKTPTNGNRQVSSFLFADSRIVSPDTSPFPSSQFKLPSRALQLSDVRHEGTTEAAAAHRYLSKLSSTCVHELKCCGFPLIVKPALHNKEKLCTINVSSCHTYLTVIPSREVSESDDVATLDCIADEITSNSTVIRVDDMERVTCGVVQRGETRVVVLPCLRVVVRARQSTFSSLSSPGSDTWSTRETYEWTFLSVEHAQSILLALPQLHRSHQ